MNKQRIRIEIIFPIILIVFSFFYVFSNLLSSEGFSLTSDEGHYYYYSYQVATQGIAVLPDLVKEYFSKVTNQFYPPPTRLAYIWLVAQSLKINPDIAMLGVFSFVAFLLTVTVHLFFCSRLFGSIVGLWSAALLASSPLVLGMARRALTDSFVNLLFVLAFWLFIDFLMNRQRYKYILFLGVFIVALLSRENAILLVPFYILFGWIWPHQHKLNFRDGIYFISALLCGLLIIPTCIYGADIWINAYLNLIFFQKQVFAINPYVSKYCSGEWTRYIIDQIVLNPIVTLLAIGYLFKASLKPFSRITEIMLIGYYLLTYVLMTPLQKNIRYVISLEMILSVMAVLMLVDILQRIEDVSKRHITGVILLTIIFVLNFLTFKSLFVKIGLLDPITFHLMRLKGFL